MLSWVLAATLLMICTLPASADSKDDCARSRGDASIAACGKAISENPEDAFSYFYRGVEYRKKADLDRSIADYDRAIALNPKIGIFYVNRGNALQDRGDLKGALADYDKAITVNPKLGSAFRNRADYFRTMVEFDLAISDYNQAIRLDPQDAASLNGRCRTFALANRELRQALHDCDAALRIVVDPDIFNSRGLVNLKLSAFEKAREDYGTAIAGNPTDSDSLYGHGLAERELGNEGAAAADIAAAIAIKPEIAGIYARYLRR